MVGAQLDASEARILAGQKSLGDPDLAVERSECVSSKDRRSK